MAVIREEKSNSKIYQLLPPVAVNATRENIAAVDVSGFESVMFVAVVGRAAVEPADDKYLEIELAHSDDNATFTECSSHEIVGAIEGQDNSIFACIKAAPERNTSFIASYIGSKRYVRPVIKATGDLGDGVLVGIAAILQGAKYLPVS